MSHKMQYIKLSNVNISREQSRSFHVHFSEGEFHLDEKQSSVLVIK